MKRLALIFAIVLMGSVALADTSCDDAAFEIYLDRIEFSEVIAPNDACDAEPIPKAVNKLSEEYQLSLIELDEEN